MLLVALALELLMIATLGAGSASAFSRTIEDIENPQVKARVLGLDVAASRSISSQYTNLSGFPGVLSTETWSHSLSGGIVDSSADAPMPEITITRNPTVVTLSGEVITAKAEGTETYNDFEHCTGSRTTTKSPKLEVGIDGFYQSGTSSSSGNPAVTLATEHEDPWVETCSNAAIDTSTRVTRISTVSSPDTPEDGVGSWAPGEGGLTTTKDSCSPSFCDFTIVGHNANSAISGPGEFYGSADSTFTLRLRLEYPSASPTPETKITRGPRKLIKTKSGKATISIAFRSTGPVGSKFRCRLDGRRFSACASPYKRRVGPGKHRFQVVSIYRGNADRSPARYVWTVKKIKPRR
ncbi:MAG: hypothetical protein J0H98_06430 [Solirubrobacterales bacterium]|nr:hypothetical protein [Solirubrobacterales bacterium]